MKLFNNIRCIFHYKWSLILLINIIIQIIIIILVYNAFKNKENEDINTYVNDSTKTIINEINIVINTIIHIINRNGRILSFAGKKIKPNDFETYMDINTLPDIVNIGYQRWYPRITYDERLDFEAFGKEYLQSNFSIIDFIQTRPSLIYEPAKNRSEYIVFAISVPPFVLYGGDILNVSTSYSNDVELAIYHNTPTPSRRTFLFALNSEINYAIRILLPVYVQNSTDFDREDLLGITELIFTPSNIIDKIIDNNLGIKRNNIDVFLYDLHETIENNESLVYRENNNKYEKYSGRNSIYELQKERYSKGDEFNINNRLYYIHFKYSDEFIDNYKRNFIPEGILIALCIMFIGIDIISIAIYRSYVNKLNNRFKNINYNIISNVNHHMRNPLNGVKGIIEIIITSLSLILYPDDTNYDISKKKLDHIEDIEVNISSYELRDNYINPLIDAYYLTIQLSNIINSANSITDMISGTSKIINMETTLENIVDHVNSIIVNIINENHHIDYNINIFDNQYKIFTDIDRISQILVILLQNAFQYTYNGVIRLSITKDEYNIIFNVIDSGIGVSNEIINSLFKIKNIKPHIIGSGGLGTYHAKLITDSIGGEIGYTKLDIGSNFWLKIPISKLDRKPSINNVI